MRPWISRALFLVGCLLAGCASAHASAEGPRTPAPEPGPPAPVDAGEDLGGDADFRAIVNRAKSGDVSAVRPDLQGFLAHHPHHAQRPAAVAMLAGALLLEDNVGAARTLLDDNASLLPAMERDFFGGICAARLRDVDRSLELLRKFQSADPPSRIGGLADPDARRLLRGALAESLAAAGHAADALDQLELYAQIDGNRPAERAFALRRAEEIAGKLADADAATARAGRQGLFVRAFLGPKVVASLRARGDAANAARVDAEVLASRRQLGLEAPAPSAVVADPLRLGLLLPFSGPQARLGDVVLRGAMMVVSAAAHGSEQQPGFHVYARDSAAPAERSGVGGGVVAGLTSLAREEKVVGLVATPDAREAELAAREGLPLLLLDERAPGAQTTTFPLLHSSEARAAALARKALALGARRFAVLGPDNASGKRLTTAFKKAVEEAGGAITALVTYPAGATSFSAEVAKLRQFPFEALFVPDDANRLELLAPALAVADLWPRSPSMAFASSHASGTAGPGRREALLLSTALGVSPKFLRTSERYVQGLLFCPGFYPSDDARQASFVSRFLETYGTLPTATDGYSYDALFVLRSAVERGARGRAEVLRVLATQTFEGLTGDIRFGVDHARVDPPLVYVVDGESVHILK